MKRLPEWVEHIVPRIIRHEGFRPRAYRDTQGIWTIGYGRNLEHVGLSTEEVAYLLRRDEEEGTLNHEIDWEDGPTLVVRRDLVRDGIRGDEAILLLSNDLRRALQLAEAIVGPDTWTHLDTARKGVLLEMAYNLGNRLRGFRRMLGAVRKGDYEAAAREMMSSQWATQVGRRAYTLSEIMRIGRERALT